MESTLLKPKDFQDKLLATPGSFLLDVRTPEEVRAGYIKGQVNFDFKSPEFKILISGLDKTRPYFVYCASGVRSGKAADMLRDLGIENVFTLDGGLKAWKADGFPIKTAPSI